MDYPFKSDGCTFSPDGIWRKCCEVHDLEYWTGGTWRERLASDRKLRDCMDEVCLQARWTEEAAWLVSRLYYLGVRVGGLIPFRRSRWGYGWRWPRTKL